jgi:LacI family transcriptional regulator
MSHHLQRRSATSMTEQTNLVAPKVAARPTVKTVAELAGVSTTTVSRVLNGKSQELSEATRQRVHEAARVLGYRPNSLAVGLRKQTTRTIGLMVPDIGNSYFHQLARGAEDTAMQAGYATIFCNTDRRPEKEITYIDLLSDKRVDGIIFTGGGVNGDSHVSERLRPDAKVVTIGPHRLPFPSVGVDDRAAIATAVEHLASQGCRDIACIGGTPGWLIHEERLEGFRRGLTHAGMPFQESLLWLTDLTHNEAKTAIDRAVAQDLRFDGLIAFSDVAAVGAMRALREHGVSIPGDVAIVGCDDTTLSTLVEPQLSSIAFPVYEFGAEATRMIIAMAENKSVEQHVEFDFELHVRASSDRSSA